MIHEPSIASTARLAQRPRSAPPRPRHVTPTLSPLIQPEAAMAGHSPDVEILVHITAPSTSADDVAYRQLARAFLSFQPASRVCLSDPRRSQDGVLEPSSSAVVRAEPSPELSFRSVLDNRGSPHLKLSSAVAFVSSSSSFCSPPSQISDSFPIPDRDILRPSPTKVLEQYLGSTRFSTASSTSSSSSSLPLSQVQNVETEVVDVPSSVPDPGRDEDADETQRTGKIIPVTPTIPQIQQRKRRGSLGEQDKLIPLDVTHISSSPASQQSSSFPTRAESEPPPSKKPRRFIQDAESVAAVQTSNNDATCDLDTLVIRPPSPPVGTAHVLPSSLIPEPLVKLERQLSSRYRPAPTSRVLEPLERGYWLFDCAAWPTQARLDAWVFLSNYVGNGVAGWGVWCRRADAPRHEWIRFYCWAYVAKHTYLLLYLASTRLVKATGATWYDSDGRPAIEVLPSEKHVS
ncbi:hypothetical protein XA68_10843 [Ophiocordyceps unilateralis]|uniref:Uncharacterized protein n=1 Tax=Ophiocordyceps unilateralis TaxID=268505 RepID=A0A2A9PH09_OPHUN|nr:hypothetical protein XA68_10843 [Ophiocordyceps unilateralis]